MKLLILSLLVVGYSSGFEDKTIFQYLTDNGYTTLVGALKTTGLDTALDSNGPLTLFAPTEAAFQKLGTAALNSLSTQQLASILKYHVVSEFVLVPMISQNTSKATLDGEQLTIQPFGGVWMGISCSRLTVFGGNEALPTYRQNSNPKAGYSHPHMQPTLLLNNVSRVDSSSNDIIVNNGAIQPIDTVLIPPQLPTENIAQVLLRQDDKFKDLFLALVLADLVKALEGSEYTVFAPTNSAFAVFNAGNFQRPPSMDPKVFYTELLKYHVVPGARRANQLKDGQMLYTLHGTPVNITITSGGVNVNDANVSEANIIATNGVIHAIDKMLIPRDLYTTQGRR